jgi:archaemetzincin
MGFGYKPGNASVASIYRVKNEEQFFKVCIHELGHNMGLSHCEVKTCFMRNAEGGNPTDEETGFCENCRTFLIGKNWTIKK